METATIVDSISAVFILALLGICLLFVGGMLIMAVVETLKYFDSVARVTLSGPGRIVLKDYTPSYQIQYTTDSYGGGGSVEYQDVPDSWKITIELLGRKRSIEVSYYFYNSIEVGDQVVAKYRLGRFSRRPYLDQVERLSSAPAAA